MKPPNSEQTQATKARDGLWALFGWGLIAFLVALAVLLAVSWRKHNGETVIVKIPADMHGLISVRIAEAGYVKPVRDRDSLSYVVPDNRELVVSHDAPFFGWHLLFVERPDGTRLRVGTVQSPPEKEHFEAWQSGGTVTTDEGTFFWIFVGSRDEWLAEGNKLNARPLHR